MKQKLNLFVCLLLLVSVASARSRRREPLPKPQPVVERLTLEVSNPSSEYREQVIGIPLDSILPRLGISVDSIRVRDAAGLDVPFQISNDRNLLIEAGVRKGGVARFTLSRRNIEPWLSDSVFGREVMSANQPLICHGAFHPERRDDFAWENDRGAYRVYGPALEQTGERSFGIDVWTKNTPELVVDSRYDLEDKVAIPRIDSLYRHDRKKRDSAYRTISYHYDHGRVFDPYRVGASLGCGAPALMVGDSIVMPYCFQRYEILDEGPLRFSVRLDQSPRVVCGDTVREHRIITLDKGSNFCRMTVWYDGLEHLSDLGFCSGVVLQPEDLESYTLGTDFVAYTDPTDQPKVHQAPLYVAALFPEGSVETRCQDHHAIGVHRNYTGEPFTYYFGSAWAKYDVRTADEWLQRIQWFLRNVREPMEVTIKSY